jgi:hypothetical protein
MYTPSSMVSAKCTSQLSCGSTFAREAAIPPSAMTVCAFPRRDLERIVTLDPESNAAIAALIPAPPAPIIRTSVSCLMYCELISIIEFKRLFAQCLTRYKFLEMLR